MHRLAGLDYEERGAGEAVCLVPFEPADAAKVTAPALLVSGAASRPWFRENAMILAEMLPDARTQTLPELDHLAPLTHPGGARLRHRRVPAPVPARSWGGVSH